MQFLSPQWLLLILFLLPLFFLLKQLQRKQLRIFKRLFPDASIHRKKRLWEDLLLGTCLFFLIVALARPVGGKAKIEQQGSGAHIFLVIDASLSMHANDENPHRLGAVIEFIRKLLEQGQMARFGVITFSGEAQMLSPLTSDAIALQSILESLEKFEFSRQGTALMSALELVKARYEAYSAVQEQDQPFSVVLFSDGEDFAGETQAFLEMESPFPVFTIGVGSETGSRIPLSRGFFGKVQYKQHQGREVVTRLQAEPLQKIAKASDAEYSHIHDIRPAQLLEKCSRYGKFSYQLEGSRKQELFGWALMVALFCWGGFVALRRFG